MVAAVRSTLATAALDMNQHRLPQPRLPVELWCKIWEHLPPGEQRLAVSHVSHDWYTAASTWPLLWSSLSFVSTLHAMDCDCTSCTSTDPATIADRCVRCRRHLPGAWTNSRHVKANLERSGGIPLSITIDNCSSGITDSTTLAGFALSLRPHAARLESLDIVIDSISALQSGILDHFDDLPNLTSFQLKYIGDEAELEAGVVISVPRLGRLKFSGRLRFASGSFMFSCPNVHTLQALVYEVADALSLLTACPAVQEAQFQVGPQSMDFPTDTTAVQLRDALRQARPRKLSVTDIHGSDINAVAAAFQQPFVPQLVYTYVGSGPRSDLLEMFHHIEHPRTLSCQVVGGGVCIRAVGPNDQLREFTASGHDAMESFIRLIWPHPEHSAALNSLVNISLDESVWNAVCGRPHFSAIAATELVIEFNPDRRSLMDWLAQSDPIPGGAMPALEYVHLKNLGHEPVSLTDIEVMNVAQAIRNMLAMGTERKLQRMTLEGFTDQSPSSAWADVALVITRLGGRLTD